MRIFPTKRGWEIEWQFKEERDYLAAILNGLCGLSPNQFEESKESIVEPRSSPVRQLIPSPVANLTNEELVAA
jgi:hypothetical protein